MMFISIEQFKQEWQAESDNTRKIFSALTDESHHRAQMTVLMRQAGLKVPGIRGPAKEDWSQFGAEPPQI